MRRETEWSPMEKLRFSALGNATQSGSPPTLFSPFRRAFLQYFYVPRRHQRDYSKHYSVYSDQGRNRPRPGERSEENHRSEQERQNAAYKISPFVLNTPPQNKCF